MTLRKKVPKRAGGRSIWEKGLTSSKFNGQKCEIFTACNNHSTPDYYNFTYVNTDNGFSNQSFENVVIRLEDDNNHPYHNRKFLNLHTIATNNHQYHEEPTTPDTLHNHHTCLQASVNENFMSSFYAKAQTPHEGGSQNHQHTAQPYLTQQPHFYQSYQNQVSTCSSAFDYYQPCPCSANNNNNPLHLWQFLLDLLADQKFKDMISWTGNAWEFKFTQPERVAYLWGKCKSRPRMTYEKLSRGLRYYYRKKIMKKTAGKRYVYEFMQGTHELTSHPLSSVLLLEAFRLPCNTFEPSINSYFEYL